jgi:hypothetical protein
LLTFLTIEWNILKRKINNSKDFINDKKTNEYFEIDRKMIKLKCVFVDIKISIKYL